MGQGQDTTAATDTAAPRSRRRNRRPGRRIGWHALRAVWLIAIGLPLVFALLAAVSLVGRDVTAPSWVKDRVTQRAGEMLGGGSLRFGSITLQIGRDLHPRVTLTDTTLRDADGQTLAEVAAIAALLSPRGLVLDRAALVQEVTLTGARIALRRDAQGALAISFDRAAATGSGTGSGSGPALRPATLLAEIDAARARPALAALEALRLTDLRLSYADARAGRDWQVADGRATLDLRRGGLALEAGLTLESGGAPATLALGFDRPAGAEDAALTIAAGGVRARDIATQSAALGWLAALDAPLDATLATTLAPGTGLGPLAVTLDIGAGALRPSAAADPLPFDAARARLRYDPAASRIAFDEIAVTSDWGEVAGSGQALGRDMANGMPQTLLGQFTLDRFTLDPPGTFATPLQIDRAFLDVRLGLAPFRAEIGQLTALRGDTTLTARGEVAVTPRGWHSRVDLTADSLAAADLLALWPTGLRPGTRDWFARNLTAGRITGLAGGLRLAQAAAPRVGLSFGFDGLDLRYLNRMPPVTAAAGHATLAAGQFTLALDQGRVVPPQGGPVALAGSVMTLPDLRRDPLPMQLDLVTDGTVTATLSLLDQPPFTFISNAGLPVTLAQGRARSTGRVTFPLKPRIRGTDVTYDFQGDLRGVSSDTLIAGRRLAAPRLTVRADNTRLSAGGAVTLDGVAATGTWSRDLGPDRRPGSRLAADVALSPGALDAFGIALPPGSVSGSGTGALRVDLPPGAPPRYTLTSDLRGIALALPAIGWRKTPGQAGGLEVAGRLGASPGIDRLALSGGGLEATGRILLTEQGGFDRATFDRLRVGDWLDAPVTLRNRGAGRAPAISLAGGTLDLRRAQFGGGQGGAGGPFAIRLDRLQVAEGIALTDFSGDFDSAGGFSGQFTGRVNGGPAVNGAVAPQDGRSAVRIVSADAGGVISAAGFLRNGVGGSLDLTLRPAGPAGAFDGQLAIRQIRVRDAPAMAALLDAISVVGLLQQLDGQGLAFDTIDARFRLDPARITVLDSSAVGPGLGISLDGVYALAAKTLDFQGVISPFFLVNSIGSVLTRRGEGLIGFNFTLTGPVSAPAVGVNPLSALTPGMFREIFRRQPPQVSP